jgi:hypothetical protein
MSGPQNIEQQPGESEVEFSARRAKAHGAMLEALHADDRPVKVKRLEALGRAVAVWGDAAPEPPYKAPPLRRKRKAKRTRKK